MKFFILGLAILSFVSCSNLSDTKIKNLTDSNSAISIKSLKPFDDNKFRILHEIENNKEIKKQPELVISDVLVDGISVNSEAKIPLNTVKSDYITKKITFDILGTFKAYKKTKLKDLLFSYENPVLIQTLAENDDKPKYKVLLDKSILLTPEFISESEIKVSINTRSIPDFYLLGDHVLTVLAEDKYTDTLIRFGDPENKNVNLKPEIENIEILKDEDKKPTYLKLTGKNFMINPKFSYSTIDGKFYPDYLTNVLSYTTGDKWETYISIPKDTKFNTKVSHNLVYSTPFGTTFKSF